MSSELPDITGYTFSDFTLSVSSAILFKGDAAIKIRRQSFDFLRFLVENPNRLVSKDEIRAAIWGDAIVTNDSLTHCLIDVRRAIGDSSKQMIQTVPRRGYIFKLPVEQIVEPLTSDIPDMDRSLPDNFQTERGDKASGRSSNTKFSLTLVMIIVGTLAIATIAFYVDDSSGINAIETNHEVAFASGRIEIRPLQVPGSAYESIYVANSRSTFDIALNRYGVVTVMHDGDSNQIPGAEIAVQGTLFESGNSPNLDIRVIDVVSEATLWSARFVGDDQDTEALLESAAARTAYVIECGLFRRFSIGRDVSAELFGLYMRGCDLSVTQKRLEFYEQTLEIIELAPNESSSYSVMALGLVRHAQANGSLLENLDLVEEARAAAEKSLAIDPNNAEGLVAMSVSLPYGDWSKKEELLRRALNNDTRYKWSRSQYSAFLHRVGRLDEALTYARRTTSIIRGPNHMAIAARLHSYTGRPIAALKLFEEAERLWPKDTVVSFERFAFEAFISDPTEALRRVQTDKVSGLQNVSESISCWNFLINTRQSKLAVESRQIHAECRNDFEFMLPRVLALVGDVDSAIAEIEKVFDRRANLVHDNASMFFFNPEMSSVRRDIRFMQIANRVKLPAYWLRTDQWPDFCSEPDLPYDCIREAETVLSGQAPVN